MDLIRGLVGVTRAIYSVLIQFRHGIGDILLCNPFNVPCAGI